MNIHLLWRLVFKTFRKRRMRWFLNQAAISLESRILDVGGTADFWRPYLPIGKEICVLNLPTALPTTPVEQEPGIRVVAGDGCKLQFADGEFDVVFSNSVIEHVGGFEQQKMFADEARRVGRTVWIQTPAWEFPMEPHYLTPCFQYLSQPVRRRLARNFTVWGWMTRPTTDQVIAYDGIRLIRKNEMRELFPDCEIITERFLSLPKSYVAFRR